MVLNPILDFIILPSGNLDPLGSERGLGKIFLLHRSIRVSRLVTGVIILRI